VRGIAMTHFTSADVVRHPLVQHIIDAYDSAAGVGVGANAASGTQAALLKPSAPA
jgi:phosphate starvation-inducible protein PhoH and related proteins